MLTVVACGKRQDVRRRADAEQRTAADERSGPPVAPATRLAAPPTGEEEIAGDRRRSLPVPECSRKSARQSARSKRLHESVNQAPPAAVGRSPARRRHRPSQPSKPWVRRLMLTVCPRPGRLLRMHLPASPMKGLARPLGSTCPSPPTSRRRRANRPVPDTARHRRADAAAAGRRQPDQTALVQAMLRRRPGISLHPPCKAVSRSS